MRKSSLNGLDQIEDAGIELADLKPGHQLLLWEDLRGIVGRAEDALRFAVLAGSLLIELKEEQCSVSLGVQLRIGSAQANARFFQHRLPRSLAGLRLLEVLAELALGAPSDHHLGSRERRPPGDVVAVGFSLERCIHRGIRADEDIRCLDLALDQICDGDGSLSLTLEGKAAGPLESWPELLLEKSGQRAGIHHVNGTRPSKLTVLRGGGSESDRRGEVENRCENGPRCICSHVALNSWTSALTPIPDSHRGSPAHGGTPGSRARRPAVGCEDRSRGPRTRRGRNAPR